MSLRQALITFVVCVASSIIFFALFFQHASLMQSIVIFIYGNVALVLALVVSTIVFHALRKPGSKLKQGQPKLIPLRLISKLIPLRLICLNIIALVPLVTVSALIAITIIQAYSANEITMVGEALFLLGLFLIPISPYLIVVAVMDVAFLQSFSSSKTC